MLCFTLYDVVSSRGLVHFLKPMLPTDNVFLQNKVFKKCFEKRHATLCETNNGFNAMSLLILTLISCTKTMFSHIDHVPICLRYSRGLVTV